MIRLFQIAVFSGFCFLLAGCDTPQQEPVWEQVKFGDIASSRRGEERLGRPLKTASLTVYVFELPADDIAALDEIWRTVFAEPVRFRDYEAFRANSFSAGFGRYPAWNGIIGLIEAAGGKRVQTISLLLPDGESNDFTIGRLRREQKIFYSLAGGSMEMASLGPGRLGLRVMAERVPGFRGLCSVHVQPVFAPPGARSIPQSAGRGRSAEYVFTWAGFWLKMGVGDFFVLGPAGYVEDPIAPASHFFGRPTPSPGVRMFVRAPGDEARMRPYFGPVVRIYAFLCARTSD
ncbi:MAG: hypothetical protein ACYS76_13085 [Planctomycetota bacterium]|jgi:hypothetical protein